MFRNLEHIDDTQETRPPPNFWSDIRSERLFADQLALFAAAWEARQAAEESKPTEGPKDPDNDTKPEASQAAPKKNNGGRKPLAQHLKRERIVHI